MALKSSKSLPYNENYLEKIVIKVTMMINYYILIYVEFHMWVITNETSFQLHILNLVVYLFIFMIYAFVPFNVLSGLLDDNFASYIIMIVILAGRAQSKSDLLLCYDLHINLS